MSWHLNDVIVALASAPGSSLRGIIRASGPNVHTLLADGFHPDDPVAWQGARVPQRHTGYYTLPGLSSPLRVSVHRWPTARSYTGQPLIELHLPGSPPILEAMLADLCRRGARIARPGEFTLRAFLAGKLDLIQAEAVLGVIDADDDAGLRTALEQLAGGIFEPVIGPLLGMPFFMLLALLGLLFLLIGRRKRGRHIGYSSRD